MYNNCSLPLLQYYVFTILTKLTKETVVYDDDGCCVEKLNVAPIPANTSELEYNNAGPALDQGSVGEGTYGTLRSVLLEEPRTLIS